jgi:deoxycytidine triphosphate deaminase
MLILPNTFTLSESQKEHRGTQEIQPDANGWFSLKPGQYEVVMQNLVRVGEGEAGWVITRSTLNRNGCFLISGLYDSGYHGAMAAVLYVTCGKVEIHRGTRIGQYLCFESEAISNYIGSYGLDANGRPKQDEAKYHNNTQRN